MSCDHHAPSKPISINHQVRSLILDYAIGAAIAALLPIPHKVLVKVIVLVILSIAMIRGIRHR
jgi:hypothetical protein